MHPSSSSERSERSSTASVSLDYSLNSHLYHVIKYIRVMLVIISGESYEVGDAPRLPAHLLQHQRDKLLVDPEVRAQVCTHIRR